MIQLLTWFEMTNEEGPLLLTYVVALHHSHPHPVTLLKTTDTDIKEIEK